MSTTRTHKGPKPIDYDKKNVGESLGIDPKIQRVIDIINNKPHAKYIRYLLSKRYSPICIRTELQRLALSAPHEKALIAYYFAVIDPVVKTFGLGRVYSDYKNKLLRTDNTRMSFTNHILKFRLEFETSIDTQIAFCKFINALEVDDCWANEIMQFYGSASNIPEDETGSRILKVPSYRKAPDAILVHPKRYMIDKLILEGLPDTRISNYARTELKMQVYDYDISYYKKVFFNMRTRSIDEKIQALEAEKNSLTSFLETVSSDDHLEMGEKILATRQTEERIKELDDSLKTLNMLFTEAVQGSLNTQNASLEQIFLDVISKSYGRFNNLNQYQDRDVVDPLFKTTRIMVMAADKLKDLKESGANGKGGDPHSQAEMMTLYRKRAEDSYNEQRIKKINAAGGQVLDGIDDEEARILGLEELGVMTDGVEEVDD